MMTRYLIVPGNSSRKPALASALTLPLEKRLAETCGADYQDTHNQLVLFMVGLIGLGRHNLVRAFIVVSDYIL
jgi:hypothetical protein